MMSVYWFAYYGPVAPSVRYRAIYPLDLLRRTKGVRTRLVIPDRTVGGAFQFLSAFIQALFSGPSSIIVIQRVSSDRLYARMLKFLVICKRGRTIYDLDDADFLEKPSKNIFWFIRNCDTVVVGSCELARNLRPLNKNIVLNTSPVPDPMYTKRSREERFTIGWIGDYSGGHRQSLIQQLFPAVMELSFPIRLTILGVRNEEGKDEITSFFRDQGHVELHIPLDMDWADERAVQQRINMIDVGIATLQDNELHRSKSAFKLKQCLNQGIPVLSTALPENEHFLQHGWNGYLCRNSIDFKQRLIDVHGMDDESYQWFSSNALRSRDRFSIAGYCDILLSLSGTRTASSVDLELISTEQLCDRSSIKGNTASPGIIGTLAN